MTWDPTLTESTRTRLAQFPLAAAFAITFTPSG